MLFACWVTKATHTHSEHVIHLAFPRQKWLCERASILHSTTLSVLLIKKEQQFRTPQEAPRACLCAIPKHNSLNTYRIQKRLKQVVKKKKTLLGGGGEEKQIFFSGAEKFFK